MKNIIYKIDDYNKQSLFVRTTSMNFNDVLEQVRQGIGNANMWILHEINTQMTLEKDDYLIRPARQILFFHPRFMAEILSKNAHAVIEAPLKIVLLQTDTNKILVTYKDPQQTFAAYHGLDRLGTELSNLLANLIDFIK